MTTFPYGYTKDANGVMGMGTQLTWDQMMTKKSVNHLHPEVQRRFHALIDYAASCGVPLGVGTGWRTQPNPPPPGFAKPGNSWHESCPVDPNSATAMAIDTVPAPSWPWMEINCGAFGFRTFKYVGNEPWHIQPVEITTSRKYASVCPTLPTWPLPGTSPTPTPPVQSGIITVQGYRITVEQGSSGKMAKMCQQQINLIAGQGLAEDGNFGPQSVAGLKNVQTVLGCTVDGQCGPKTWQAMENGIKTQTEAGDWD